jgi:hypothetical protein
MTHDAPCRRYRDLYVRNLQSFRTHPSPIVIKDFEEFCIASNIDLPDINPKVFRSFLADVGARTSPRTGIPIRGHTYRSISKSERDRTSVLAIANPRFAWLYALGTIVQRTNHGKTNTYITLSTPAKQASGDNADLVLRSHQDLRAHIRLF